MKWVLVIPAFNEVSTLRAIVSDALTYVSEVIVVDDGSTDGSSQQLQGLPVTLFSNTVNHGKGYTLYKGFNAALSQNATHVITMDADGQHQAADLPRLIHAACKYPERLIIGSRLRHRTRCPWQRRIANTLADFWISWAAGRKLLDTQSGFRIYPKALCSALQVPPSRQHSFVFETQVLLLAAQRSLSCAFVPIDTLYPQDARASHFRSGRDLRAIIALVARSLISRKLYFSGLIRSCVEKPIVIDESLG